MTVTDNYLNYQYLDKYQSYAKLNERINKANQNAMEKNYLIFFFKLFMLLFTRVIRRCVGGSDVTKMS